MIRLAPLFALLFCATTACAAPVCKVDTAPAAKALGVPAVTATKTVTLPAQLPYDALWLTIDGTSQGSLMAASGCTGSAAPLPLGPATALSILAGIDLDAPPARISLKAPEVTVVAPASHGRAAILLLSHYVRADGAQADILFLIALEKTPRIVWQEDAAALAPDGGGFRSGSVAFSAQGAWPDITLYQTTVPGAGEQPAMPGPPLEVRARYDGKAYQTRP